MSTPTTSTTASPTPTPGSSPAGPTNNQAAVFIVIGLTCLALLIAALYYFLRYKTTLLTRISQRIRSLSVFQSRTRLYSDDVESPKRSRQSKGSMQNLGRGGSHSQQQPNPVRTLPLDHSAADQGGINSGLSSEFNSGHNHKQSFVRQNQVASSSGSHHNLSKRQPTGQTTLWDTPQEIAIPVFMKAKEEIDFLIVEKNRPLMQGGSAAIFKIKILAMDIRKRMLKPDRMDLKNEEYVADEDMELACIKVWPSDELGEADPEVVAAFHQELGIMWRFRETPNFCQLYAYSEWPTMAIIMKYYSGQSLKHYIRSHFNNYPDHPIPYIITFQILVPLCRAIAVMHASGIIHCDIKSGNILLEWVMPPAPPQSDRERLQSQTASMSDDPAYDLMPIPVPYITDFGISNVLDQSSSLRVKAFQVANIRGASLPYSAPEVLDHLRAPAVLGAAVGGTQENQEENLQRATGRDTYALACVIYEMLVGRSPWSYRSRKH